MDPIEPVSEHFPIDGATLNPTTCLGAGQDDSEDVARRAVDQHNAMPFAALHEDELGLSNESDGLQPVRRSWIARTAAACLVTAAGASLIFEQSPANEALRVNAGLNVLDSTQSALAVGLTTAAITTGIEFGSSALISLGLHTESGAVDRLKNRMSEKSKQKFEEAGSDKKSRLSKIGSALADISISMGIGAGLVTMRHHVKNEEPSLAKDLKTSAAASAFVAANCGAIGYLVAGGVEHTQGTFLEYPAELLVDYGTNNVFWLSLFAGGFAIYKAKNAIKQRMHNRETTGSTSGEMDIDEIISLDLGN